MIRRLFQVSQQSTLASLALLVLRLVAGSAFVLHGWGKIQNPMAWMGPESPVPGVLQLLAAVSEFGGGAAWILGVLTPLASFGLTCTMAVAVHMHFIVLQDPFVHPTGGRSFEPALGYLAVALVLMFVGPGKFSLDKKLFN